MPCFQPPARGGSAEAGFGPLACLGLRVSFDRRRTGAEDEFTDLATFRWWGGIPTHREVGRPPAFIGFHYRPGRALADRHRRADRPTGCPGRCRHRLERDDAEGDLE